MPTTPKFPSYKSMTLLSRLLLVPQQDDAPSSWMLEELKRDISSISRQQFDDLLDLANLNHVVVRGMNFPGMVAACARCSLCPVGTDGHR